MGGTGVEQMPPTSLFFAARCLKETRPHTTGGRHKRGLLGEPHYHLREQEGAASGGEAADRHRGSEKVQLLVTECQRETFSPRPCMREAVNW